MDKGLIKTLYASGLNAAEIAKDLGLNKAAVNKCIQRNFKEIKEIHLRNRQIYKSHKKEVQRILNYESKQFMSDKTFILKNRSIYRTKQNGDITLKKENEIGCAVPWDVPRRLANELSCN